MTQKLFVFVFLLAWTLSAAAVPTEMRTWTDARGRKVTARAVSMSDGVVVLENANGARVSIAIQNFSKQDQAYLRQHFSKDAAAAPFPVGETTDEIKTRKHPEWSYFLYLPKNFHMNRQWPVMVAMGPTGGVKRGLDRYSKGAEFNGWILAMPVQSKNVYDRNVEAVSAVLDDVRERLPIDEKRLYATGFSGGARVAFRLAAELKKGRIAGVLPCGAGGYPREFSSKVVIYGLCGTSCYNRWDMACTMKETRNKSSRLVFFLGGHTWAPPDYLTDGMTYLNGCYLKNAPNTDRTLIAERDQFAQRLLAQIEGCLKSKPEWAYEWALFLSDFPGPAATVNKARTHLKSLQQQSKIQLYAAALADLNKFVKKHFATDRRAHHTNNGTPEAKRDAEELSEKYKDTILVNHFRKMGERSVMP